MVTFINLGRLTAVFRWHQGLEERYRRSVEIKLSGDALLLFGRLVSQNFLVWWGLDVHVSSARHWLRRWDITVRVQIPCFLGRASFSERPNSLGLLHHHRVGISSSRNYHRRTCASSHNSAVMHDILGEVLSANMGLVIVTLQNRPLATTSQERWLCRA